MTDWLLTDYGQSKLYSTAMGLVSVFSSCWAGGRVRSGQVTSLLQGTTSFCCQEHILYEKTFSIRCMETGRLRVESKEITSQKKIWSNHPAVLII